MLKLLSFNIHKGVGWHRFHSTFNAMEDHIRLLSPDILFFQEILGVQAEKIVSDIWQNFSYGRNAVYPKGHFGNAIISKFPIIFSENLDLSNSRFDRRGLLHSIIEYKDQQVHLLCVHLGLFKKYRLNQFAKIINYIQHIIPPNAPIILAGDFNDWGSHATVPLEKELGLHETFKLLHGSYARTFPAWKPILKLDRIYSREIKVIEAERKMEKSWRKLSDHIAIQALFDI